MKLFFLPHAGGSARSYCSWKRFLPKEWKVVPLEPSGRGSRSSEGFCKTIQECAENILEKYGNEFDEPYIFFGHSMGSMLVTELTRLIAEKNLRAPSHVFLSGRCAVNVAFTKFPDFSGKTDSDIISFFLEKGLFVEKTAENEELWNILASILCADVRMTEKYYLSPESFKFPCPITVMYGKQDSFLDEESMQCWEQFTDSECRILAYEGGHFYCNDLKEELCGEIISAVTI